MSHRSDQQNPETMENGSPRIQTNLFVEIPGIHEPGAWGKLRSLRIEARIELDKANIQLRHLVVGHIYHYWKEMRGHYLDLIKEINERLHMRMEMLQEQAAEIVGYMSTTPFMELEDIQELQRRKSQLLIEIHGIQNDLAS